MIAYEEIMRQAMAKQNTNYGEYTDGDFYKEIDGDDILYCKVCKEPKQMRTFISTRTNAEFKREYEEYALKHRDLSSDECYKRFMEIKPPKDKRQDLDIIGIPCKCQRDYKAGIVKSEKSDERIKRIKYNKLKCFPTVEFQKETYNKYEENKLIKCAKRYSRMLGHWLNNHEKKNSLVLCGNTGSGKTIASLCLCNDLLDKEFDVVFKVQPEITYIRYDELSSSLNSLIDCGVLVIDDFNLQVASDRDIEKILYLIDGRVKRNKPFILTTNHSINDFTNVEEIKYKRIMNRIAEVAYLYDDSSNNYRLKQEKEN